MHLVPADDHDESLAWQRAQLSDEERCRRNEAEADFVRAAATRLPSGTEGFADLARDAVTLAVGDVPARVASLEDVIRSKRAAGRPKDLAVLPTLIATAQRQNRNRPAPE